MGIVRPGQEQVLALQQRQGSYYYSGAAEIALRKLGIDVGFDRPIVVTRETGWDPSFEGREVLFEGCLSEAVAKEMRVGTRRTRTSRLSLLDADGRDLGTVVYNKAAVRWIPYRRGDDSEPYPFVSEDPLWNTGEVEYQTLDSSDGTPVLFAREDGGSMRTVGVRLNQALVLGVPVLDVVVQHHATPPYEAGFYSMLEWSDLAALEAWLIGQLGEFGLFPTREIWPAPYRAALTIRHDYDRPIRADALESLLDFYDARGIRSTWFWRTGQPDREQSQAVMRAGHEIALHTEAPTQTAFRDELQLFERCFGVQPLGYSAHGGIPAPGNLGLRQIEWAIAAGMSYGEILGNGNVLPHQAVVVREGVPAVSNLLVPAAHESLDVSTAPDAHRLHELLPKIKAALSRGEQCVVMNHPDLNAEPLRELIDQLDLDGVWLATLAQVAEWLQGSRPGDEH